MSEVTEDFSERQSSNLGAAYVKVYMLICTTQQNPDVITVGRIDGHESLFVDGSIYGQGTNMLVDTRAFRTIMWQPEKNLLLTSARRSLRKSKANVIWAKKLSNILSLLLVLRKKHFSD